MLKANSFRNMSSSPDSFNKLMQMRNTWQIVFARLGCCLFSEFSKLSLAQLKILESLVICNIKDGLNYVFRSLPDLNDMIREDCISPNILSNIFQSHFYSGYS